MNFDFERFYGPFHAGAFPIGSEIPGQGEVLWSYQSAARGLVYVIGGWRAQPIEIEANKVERDKPMSGLTFYGLVTDLEKLKQAQEQALANLAKMGQLYPGLKRDARFHQIEDQGKASLEIYKQIISEYHQRNQAEPDEVQEPALVRGYYPSEDAIATGHLWGIQHDDDTHEVFFFMENTTIEKTIKETGAIHYRFPDGCVLILHDGMARTEEEVKAERDELVRQHQHEENARLLNLPTSHSDDYVPGEEE